MPATLPVPLSYTPRGVTLILGTVAALILALGYAREIAAAYGGVPTGQFIFTTMTLNAELSLLAWFSSGLLALNAVMMWLAGASEQAARRTTALGWRLLAVIFVYLSLDEMVSMHENYDAIARRIPNPFGLFYYGWVVTGLVAALAVGVAFVPFLLRLPRSTAFGLVVAGAIFVGGAVGMEMVDGAVAAAQGLTNFYVVLTCIEETLETLGLVLCARTLLYHVADHAPFSLSIARAPQPEARAAQPEASAA